MHRSSLHSVIILDRGFSDTVRCNVSCTKSLHLDLEDKDEECPHNGRVEQPAVPSLLP